MALKSQTCGRVGKTTTSKDIQDVVRAFNFLTAARKSFAIAWQHQQLHYIPRGPAF